MTVLGAIFPPDLPPERLRPVALAAEGAGLEQLWLWEDCFKESGVAAAAAVLGWTERLSVGIGLMPVPLRNVALCAMEVATLERLFPGRLVAGIGHGVLDWMAQVGERAPSPMTLLREYTAALAGLLGGETVTTSGRFVQLDGVALDWPPSPRPPLLVGAVGAKTLALAGELSDGAILDGSTSPETLRTSVEHVALGRRAAGRTGAPDIVVFATVAGTPDAAVVADQVAALVDGGATHVALHSISDGSGPGGPVSGGPPLEDFVRFVAADVRPLVP